MKHSSEPRFVAVARLVTNEPPEWLMVGLEHFGEFVGREKTEGLDGIIRRMKDAADTLLKFLPAFKHLPLGLPCPPDVPVVLDALPRVKQHLDRLGKKRTGRPTDVRRQLCANVVVEAWKLIHGKTQPRSDKLYDACSAYWRACGGKEIGETSDPSVWRRNVEKASANAGGWGPFVTTILSAMAQNYP
jgi:hypothetical protein